VSEPEMAVFHILTTLAECSAILAAFVGVAGIFRIHVLLERRRDAESEVRFWTKRLTKQDTFTVPFADVLALLSDEQTRVAANPPHEDLLAAAIAADRRRGALGAVLRRARATLLLLEGWNLSVAGAAVIAMSCVPTLAVASGFSSIGMVTIPAACRRYVATSRHAFPASVDLVHACNAVQADRSSASPSTARAKASARGEGARPRKVPSMSRSCVVNEPR